MRKSVLQVMNIRIQCDLRPREFRAPFRAHALTPLSASLLSSVSTSQAVCHKDVMMLNCTLLPWAIGQNVSGSNLNAFRASYKSDVFITLYSCCSMTNAFCTPCVFCCVSVYSLAWIRRISCVPHCKSRQPQAGIKASALLWMDVADSCLSVLSPSFGSLLQLRSCQITHGSKLGSDRPRFYHRPTWKTDRAEELSVIFLHNTNCSYLATLRN